MDVRSLCGLLAQRPEVADVADAEAIPLGFDNRRRARARKLESSGGRGGSRRVVDGFVVVVGGFDGIFDVCC